MIYFVLNHRTGQVKIGFTDNSSVAERITNIRSASGDPIELIHEMEGDRRVEVLLHHRFHHLMDSGEWFVFGDEIKEFIAFDGSSSVPPLRTVTFKMDRDAFDKIKVWASSEGISSNQKIRQIIEDAVSDENAPEVKFMKALRGVRNISGDVWDGEKFVPYNQFHAED